MTTGSAIVDFGAAPGTDLATVAVTGQGGILTTSKVEAWLDPAITPATADHTIDEHIMATAMTDVTASNIVAGTGFTINCVVRQGNGVMIGKFNVSWVWV